MQRAQKRTFSVLMVRKEARDTGDASNDPFCPPWIWRCRKGYLCTPRSRRVGAARPLDRGDLLQGTDREEGEMIVVPVHTVLASNKGGSFEKRK
eukprot:s334_g21.t1